jgi:thiamine phosphate synthase YjbQ (UPF0047 family)
MPTSSTSRLMCRGSWTRLAWGRDRTWQQLVLLDFDDRPRERTVVVQVLA